jgi:putative tryptophan/tyrosine transport system substrate-binding protein
MPGFKYLIGPTVRGLGGHMQRREFITLLGATALAWPLAARARAPKRIGFLGLERRLEKFRQGLRDLGYVEGRSIVIEYRPSDPADRLPGFAAELVALNVDVIVAGGSLAVRAAQQATSTIPIVMTGTSDPVGTGFVASLARPGGNITGLSLLSPELSGKRLELLRQITKDPSRLAILLNPDGPAVVSSLRETEKAARASGMEISLVEARSGEDLDGAFALIAKIQPEALVILPASLMTRYAARIAELALNSKTPTISYFREFPEVGGLMSYGPSLDYSARRAAVYVDRILKGAKPSDLSVQQPTKFELVINLKTAKALSLTVPKRVSARADELIE